MAIHFGMTWWGEQWLNSLSNIDFDNRLPRGRNYAAKGAVSKIEINDNIIRAKVKGSRVTPYKVVVAIQKFTQQQIDSLIDKILEYPVILSQLLNRELNPQIMDICRTLEMQIFPKTWKDLDMDCSCPDWAVPCKHLAAVIYMMSLQIDNNPFIIFELHGVDFKKELAKRGVSFDSDSMNEIPEFSSLLLEKEDKSDDVSCFQRIDMSGIRDNGDMLCGLLSKNPPFYPFKDFQKLYQQNINTISRKIGRVLNGKCTLSEILKVSPKNIFKSDKIQFCIDSNFELGYSLTYNEEDDERDFCCFEELVAAVMNINPDYLSDYDNSVSAFYQLVSVALHLLCNSCVVPQIIMLQKNKYAVRWLPSVLNQEVRSVLNCLEKTVPSDLLLSKFSRKKSFSPVEKSGGHLLSCIITCIIPYLLEKYNDKVTALFFNGKSFKFDDVSENEIPANIKVWLEKFFITASRYKPTLLISEHDEIFSLDLAIDYDGEIVMLKNVFDEKRYEIERFSILKEFSLLSSMVASLDKYINEKGKNPISYDLKSFAPFLVDVIPIVRLLGVKVMLPKSLQNLLRPRPSVKISKKKTSSKSFIRLDDLLDFDWQVALGDELMSEEDFIKLLDKAEGLIRFRNSYIYVDENDLERLRKMFSSDKGLSKSQIMMAALSESFDRNRVELTDEVRSMIEEMSKLEEVAVPDSINAILRPYQKRGYSWMYKNMKIGFGSIIADDMGLGKTLQVITLLQKIKDDGLLENKSVIIVVPTGLIMNWKSELERFAPKLTCFVYHGPQRDIKSFESDILLTTYGVVRSDIDVLKKKKWELAVIDEAQNIKNADTAQSKAVKSLPSAMRIAMSGTPVENRLSEFWSIMDFVNKGYLGNIGYFQQNFSKPIQDNGDKYVAEQFRKITAPFMMRRLKTDKSIISDLPDKIEQNVSAILSERQLSLYEQTLNEAMKEIEGVVETDNQSMFKRQGLVLQMILALKQICNHPALFLKNGDLTPEHSGKMLLVLDMLRSIVESEQKVLVFTQFKEMGDILQRVVANVIGEKPLFLHGGCSVKQRQNMVDRFQNERHERIFILSLKAAGTGLNLTAATHVIHYDLWWNPAVEAQATDRAYRIGQHQNVMVHRFITRNTFEERINAMIQDKKELAEMTVSSGENWIGKLSNKELRDIFTIKK